MVVVVVLLVALVAGLAVALLLERRNGKRRVEALNTDIAKLNDDVTSAAAKAEEANAEASAAYARADRSDDAASAATERATAAEDAHAALLVTQEEADARRALDEQRLWALEVARSERTWRHSVSIRPADPSPLVDAADPLRSAVEIEAAALHEDTGAPLEVHWELALDQPERRLIVLRTAQELLALAAHEGTAFTLHAAAASGGSDVVFGLTPADLDDAIELDDFAERLNVSNGATGLVLPIS